MEKQESEIAIMTGVEVVNSRHDGYRRAGLVLKKGKNEFPPLTATQIECLENDPFLTILIVGDVNENSDISHGSVGDVTGSQANLDTIKNGNESSGATVGAGADNQNPPQDPPPDESDLKLSQTCLAALAETDPLIYFNQDGSPRITKWRETTGNESLTKEAVIAAIELAKKPKE